MPNPVPTPLPDPDWDERIEAEHRYGPEDEVAPDPPAEGEDARALAAVIKGFKSAGISKLSINGVRIYPPETLADTHPNARVYTPEDIE